MALPLSAVLCCLPLSPAVAEDAPSLFFFSMVRNLATASPSPPKGGTKRSRNSSLMDRLARGSQAPFLGICRRFFSSGLSGVARAGRSYDRGLCHDALSSMGNIGGFSRRERRCRLSSSDELGRPVTRRQPPRLSSEFFQRSRTSVSRGLLRGLLFSFASEPILSEPLFLARTGAGKSFSVRRARFPFARRRIFSPR